MESESSTLDTKQDAENLVKDEKESKEETANVSKDEGTSLEKKTEVKANKSNEAEIGISEYLGKHNGFFGILKQRYSDFVVNEINSAGEVVHLTDRKVPPVPEVIPEMPTELPPELTPNVLEQLDELVGIPRPARIPLVPLPKRSGDDEDMTEDLSESASKVEKNVSLEKKAEPTEILIDVNNVTKEGRTNIHRAVKAKYTSITSFYKEGDDGNKYIVIQNKKSGGNIPKRNSWPKSSLYTTFVLYKENIDTIDAINHLARKTGVKANMFAYAGTKDKRGKTSQLVSVPRVAPERLCQAANFRLIHLGNFRFLPTPQKLGQLRGNKFRIVLREVKDNDEVIMSAVEALKTNGFINYFGSQRFGTTSVSTHSIGRELLKSNWQKAVNLILAPRDNDNPVIKECRTIWKETGDAEAALKVLGRERDSFIEGKLLSGLRDFQRNDLVGALGLIPRNVRVLYLHAYQSFIWNKVVSRRIAKYGLKVLPGDIIRHKNSSNLKDEDLAEEMVDDENKTDVDGENDSEKKDEQKGEKNELSKANIHIVSEEEAKVTHISDVLLPLPGYRIEYPKNEMKDWFIELLEADGLTIDALNHRVKCYSVIGSYRRLVVQPSDITSCITYYSDPTKPLIQSDMDKLLSELVDDNLLKEGPYKAVIIEMSLPASTYATMALRELLKMDTSSAFQAKLNEVCYSVDSRPGSERGFERSGYRGRGDASGDYHGRGKRNWQSHGRGRYRGDSSRDFGGGGKGGRGEKRHWRGHHGRGSKRGRFSHKEF